VQLKNKVPPTQKAHKAKSTKAEDATNTVKYAGYADSDEEALPGHKQIPGVLEISDTEDRVARTKTATGTKNIDVANDSEEEAADIQVSTKVQTCHPWISSHFQAHHQNRACDCRFTPALHNHRLAPEHVRSMGQEIRADPSSACQASCGSMVHK
jgi:hypothetical protein